MFGYGTKLLYHKHDWLEWKQWNPTMTKHKKIRKQNNINEIEYLSRNFNIP